MNTNDDRVEIFESRVEAIGADSINFILDGPTYINIQILIRGKVKVIPTDLINNIAKVIREYEVKKEVK